MEVIIVSLAVWVVHFLNVEDITVTAVQLQKKGHNQDLKFDVIREITSL